MESFQNENPKKVWDEKTVQVNKLNDFDLNSRRFKRAFLNGASHLKKDGADRVNLPNTLLEFAGITGNAILAAVNDRVEVWSAKQWEAQMEIDNPSLFLFRHDGISGHVSSQMVV